MGKARGGRVGALVVVLCATLAACTGLAGPTVHIRGKVLGDAMALGANDDVPLRAHVACNGVSATSAADGSYALAVPKATQYACTADALPTYDQLKATVPGGSADTITLNFGAQGQATCSSEGNSTDILCGALPVRTGMVHGTVTYADGTLASGGRVACANTGDVASGLKAGYSWPAALTDGSGAFTVRPKRPGQVACVAYAPTGDAQRQEVAVQAGTDAQVNFQVCDRPCHPVHYHGGPVMHAAKAYLIFWLPSGSTYEPGGSDVAFEALMQRYVADVNGSGLSKMMAQYWDYQGPAGGPVTLGGVSQDSGPYQHCQASETSCTPAKATTADPLTDADIQDEVLRALRANAGWTASDTSLFFVFTGYGAEECQRGGSSWCTFGDGDHGFCGYHSSFSATASLTPAIYAYIPSVANGDGRCNLPTYVDGPNHDNVGDATLDVVSHEQFEAETDPDTTSGWFDDSSSQKREGEIGDKCVSAFGGLGPDNGNVTLNGHHYLLQKEWSNAANGCAFS